jgi:hypothetical protein
MKPASLAKIWREVRARVVSSFLFFPNVRSASDTRYHKIKNHIKGFYLYQYQRTARAAPQPQAQPAAAIIV